MSRSTRSKPWPGFTSVLCPIDFSEHSRLALRYGEAVALRSRGTLTVSYANDPLLVAAAAAALHDRRIAQRSANELRAFVDATLARDSFKQLRVRSHVSVGDPADEILKTAERGRATLIVLGTQGLTGASRLLLGSTTLSVLQQAKVPVLAIPVSREAQVTAPSPSWPGARITAALEIDGPATADVDAAVRIARWFGSTLLLAHIVSEVSPPDWMAGDLTAHERIRVAAAQQQLDVLAARSRRSVDTESRVTCGSIADEIAALAAVERIQLVVTALRDRRGWFGARRGSVSYHVLSHAVSPVLAIPPGWRG